MYPDLQYIAQSIFGSPMPAWLGVVKTFGLFVALAFLAASAILTKEIKRKEGQGLLQPEREIKKNNTTGDAITKLVYPHQRVGTIVMLCLIGGLIGAKVFNAFETWKEFLRDPVANLFSGGGLTFYGGLLVAGALVIYYIRKHKISLPHLADAVAPALMLAYGIGRLGCHFSGDGDWGVFNSAYTTLDNGLLKAGTLTDYQQALNHSTDYFPRNFGSLPAVPHLFAPAPAWLPDWLFAGNFRHNVINEGVSLTGCSGSYCSVLPVGVFPTSLYEAVICILLFGVLWAVRKKFKYAFHLFGLYLILNGLERFFIEKIKVNYKYDWGFLHPAQSEIIAILLVLLGLGIMLFYKSTPATIKSELHVSDEYRTIG